MFNVSFGCLIPFKPPQSVVSLAAAEFTTKDAAEVHVRFFPCWLLPLYTFWLRGSSRVSMLARLVLHFTPWIQTHKF